AASIQLRSEKGPVGFGTPILGLGVVACASTFGDDVESLTDTATDRRYKVVRHAKKHDLLFLTPEEGKFTKGIAPAKRSRAVGSFVAVLDREGVAAGGVLSASARSIPMSAAMLMEGGPQEQVKGIIERVADVAEMFGQEEIAALARELMKSFDLRDAFSTGSPLRPYPQVISIDAAVGPRHAGAPVVDTDGSLLGVVVANAHFGTSYAVPVDVILEAFGGQEKQAEKPSGKGSGGAF
ncbi:MAG: hypothetical protein ACYS22_19545, partial [Planctomycetota bacterium]